MFASSSTSRTRRGRASRGRPLTSGLEPISEAGFLRNQRRAKARHKRYGSAGITKERQLHLLDLTEHLVELKNQTSPSPTKCRPQTNEGTKGSKATAAKRRPKERSEAARATGQKA